MLRKILSPAILLLVLAPGATGQAHPSCAVVPKTFAAMHNCYRALLVFAPHPDDAQLRRQEKLLDGDADDMMDRFVLFTPVAPDGKSITPPLDAPWTILPQEQMNDLRRHFHIPDSSFTVLLLDEDGSILFRGRDPVDPFRLNRIIDRTPLRRAEMRRRDAN